MKKITLLAFATAITIVACGQKIDASKVPNTVKSAFEKQYPGIRVAKWEKENDKYEANFSKDGKAMSTLQQADGKIVETEISIKISELPLSIVNYVKQHHPGKKIKDASKITNDKGEQMYEAGIPGKDLLFNKDGKFIKESKD